MSIILWIIAIPAIIFIIGQVYEGLVSDFSGSEKRREQAKRSREKYQMATDDYIGWLFSKIWILIKFVAPVLLVCFLYLLVTTG